MASNKNQSIVSSAQYQLKDDAFGRVKKNKLPLLEFLAIQNFIFSVIDNAKKKLSEDEMNVNKLQESSKKDQGRGKNEFPNILIM